MRAVPPKKQKKRTPTETTNVLSWFCLCPWKMLASLDQCRFSRR